MTADLHKITHALTPLIHELFGERELTGRQIVNGLAYLNPDWVWLILGMLTAEGELVIVEGYKPSISVYEHVWRRPKL